MVRLIEENLDGVFVLRILGSLTLSDLHAIEPRFDALASEKGVRAVVDIGNVDAVTTPAITLLLRTSMAIERNGGKMVFANPTPAIARMLACCRLDVVLTLTADVGSAMGVVQRRAYGAAASQRRMG